MKKIIMFLSVCATVTLLALPALANRPQPQPDQPQEPCSLESRTALYKAFMADYKGDTAKANEAAKKYVACPADQTDDAEVSRVKYLNNWIAKYEKANRFTRMTQLVIDKKFAEAFPIGKDILNDEPDNLKVILDLTNAGYAANNASLDGDTVTYAKKSIQLIESGKAPEKWAPFDSKEDALGWLNYIIATRIAKNSQTEAIPYFIKAASYEGKIKKLPFTYNALGEAYEKGPHAKQSADYKAKYENKDETPESKLALENINQIVDRMIDANARAVALAGTDPQYADIKAKSLDAATFYYKVRNKSDAGLTDMIASVLSKPLPPEPTPLTSLPTPPTTPGSGPGTSASGTSPAATNGATTQGSPAKTTAASSPAKAPGTTKPKMRRAHGQP